MDKALLVITALILSALLGIFWRGALPGTAFPARALREGERKLNRENRGMQDLKFRGAIFAGLVILTSLFLGWLVSLILLTPVFTILLLAFLLPVGSSWQRINRLKKHLKSGNLPAARRQMEGTVSRHHAVMEHAALKRAAIEYLAVQFGVKIVSPIFWFFILGVPGLFMCVATNFMQETLASGSGKANEFRSGTNYFYDVVNYIPARLGVFLWMLALLFFSGNRPAEIWQKIVVFIPTASPPHIMLLVAANGLKIILGGKSSAYYHAGWVGAGRMDATTSDITRAQFIYIIAGLIMFVGIGLFI